MGRRAPRTRRLTGPVLSLRLARSASVLADQVPFGPVAGRNARRLNPGGGPAG